MLASLFWHVNVTYRDLNRIVLGKHECFGCLTQQLRLRCEVDHTLHIAFGKRVLIQRPLCLNERGMLLSV